MISRLCHVLALAGSGAVFAAAVAGLSGYSFAVSAPGILPVGGGMALGMDRLSAFFLLVIASGSAPAALYAIGYTRNRKDATAGIAFVVFIAAMVLVVLARNVLTFLVCWEGMSLASYFLVMTENERSETRSAGWLYAVMTHAGLACLLIGFLVLASAAGSASMQAWVNTAAPLDARTRNIVFVVMAAGFLAKAGAIPLHIWLPRAHPAAPSHVSAVMSGVMIKLGIYGLIRLGFEWLGPGPGWWGGAILAAGAVSALAGVLYAIIDSDLKRLLAYSSVENVGVILLGVGSALLFRAYGLGGLAALALVAALLHTLNHALFKCLLFLGAGSVLHATGTRDIEQMGGLLRRMPQTGALFFAGCLAISAMPPFNGFVSEWLTFQSLLLSFRVPDRFFNLIFALAIAALALTAGLAAACFVRAFGVAFLALPRGESVNGAHEPHGTMRAAMMVLALSTLALGVGPAIVLRPLSGVVAEFIGERPDLTFSFAGIAAGNLFAAIAPGRVALLLGISMLAVFAGLYLAGANMRRRYYETWACGRAVQSAAFEYTGAAFANPFKRVFAVLYRPESETIVETHGESRFFVKAITYRHESASLIEESIYRPIAGAVRKISRRTRTVQSGNVHAYLLYIFIALVVMLLVAK